jgi:hypothetical protein
MADESDVFRKLDRVSVDSATHFLRVLHELGRGDAPRSFRKDTDRPDTRDVVFDIARVILSGYEQFLGLQERYFDVVADGVRDLYRPRTPRPLPANGYSSRAKWVTGRADGSGSRTRRTGTSSSR